MQPSSILLALGLAACSAAHNPGRKIETDRKFQRRNSVGTETTVFEHVLTDSSIEYATNSGICETTPDVNHYSGYFSVGTNMGMWFWFFEARNDPQNAPVAIWLNGGPGSASTIGAFMGNGPCLLDSNGTKPNPSSWNNYANMLYIDQPIGVGFSYGTAKVNSTAVAVSHVWKFMQAFFVNFPQYESREFGLFTMSYGGHYGPAFADHFLEKNDKIETGAIKGQKIDMIALGIDNGWIDAALQSKAYVTYAYENSYRQLISSDKQEKLRKIHNVTVLPALSLCTAFEGNDTKCASAQQSYTSQILEAILLAPGAVFHMYDVRKNRAISTIGTIEVDPLEEYLERENVKKAIGAHSKYLGVNWEVNLAFASTGDGARSLLPQLSDLVRRNITTLIWAGDADWICNSEGNLWAVDAIEWEKRDEFASMSEKDYAVNGSVVGQFKTLDNLSWLNVFEAGHGVGASRPEVALQVFVQTMKRQSLHST